MTGTVDSDYDKLALGRLGFPSWPALCLLGARSPPKLRAPAKFGGVLVSITSLALSTPSGLPPTSQLFSLTSQLAGSHAMLRALNAEPPPAPAAPAPSAQTTAQQLASILNTLSKFIPGDILTIYLGVEAAIKSGYPIPPTNVVPPEAVRLAHYNFWFCFAFTVIWIVLLRFVSARASQTEFIPPIWPALAGVTAFWIYAWATDIFWLNPPGLQPPSTVYLAIAVFLVTAVLTMLNKVVGTAFPNQMVS